MKWQILYLIVVLLSLSSIVSPNLETATQRSSDGQLISLALSSECGVSSKHVAGQLVRRRVGLRSAARALACLASDTQG